MSEQDGQDEPNGGRAPVWRTGWLAAFLVLPPLLFVWLSSVRLDAQGAYYDELHQATGAFTYVGSPPDMFALATVRGHPMLNMEYSGAIKTAIYGSYLRFVNPRFGIVSWRMVGVLFVAVGFMLFVWFVHPRVAPVPLAVVLALLMTDQTVLLFVRHDWGPIALALMLRLVLIGVWLRDEAADVPSERASFALGFLVSLMTFEKLSSCVMLIAVVCMVMAGQRRSRRHVLAIAGGGAVGALPLLFVNIVSFRADHALISLRNAVEPAVHSWHGLIPYAHQYLSLGAGEYARSFILGDAPSGLSHGGEPWLIVLALLLASTLVTVLHGGARSQPVLAAIGCYVSIGVALYLFPVATGEHHWVLGTPFQYVAIGLALESVRRAMPATGRANTLRMALSVTVGALLAVRVAGMFSLERALQNGASSREFDPSLTRLGMFAADHADDAIFIAADWGVATQIYCLSNGRPGLVREAFWSYRGPQDLLSLQQRSHTRVLYAVALNPPSVVAPTTTARIFQDLTTSEHWRETVVEPEAAALRAVTVRKFLLVDR